MREGGFSDKGVISLYEVTEPEFLYSATLRVYGAIGDLDAITRRMGLMPSYVHRKGERPGPRSPEHKHDMWQYRAPLEEQEPLEAHIDVLWKAIRPHADYLKSLREGLSVDVFCGVRTNCSIFDVEVGSNCLEIFSTLKVPFSLSVIVIGEDEDP